MRTMGRKRVEGNMRRGGSMATVSSLRARRVAPALSFAVALLTSRREVEAFGVCAGGVCTYGVDFRSSHNSAWTHPSGARRHGALASLQREAAEEEAPAVRLEDRGVPMAHRGLHDFLYSADEDHGASTQGAARTVEVFDGTQLYKVEQWVKDHGESRHAAVYAVIGADDEVKFVGLSRNVALSLGAHLKNEGPQSVDRIRVHSYRFPRREEMERLRDEWIAACPQAPRGNAAGTEWMASIREAGTAAMTDEQRRAYEENKLKMRRAMADTTLIDELEQMSSEDIHMREAMLKMAVEGDDWSAVINAQTSATVDQQRGAATTDAPVADAASADAIASGAVVSPFAGGAAELPGSAPAPSECKGLEFTMENVDRVLDEVRPYLIADGGNCRVVGVDAEAMTVSLALQGACGSCPSSTMTMKMGIERVLLENFEGLQAVVQVPDGGGAALADLTTDIVEQILEPIRPAIAAMKGHVQVKSAYDGVVTLTYKGSLKIAYGIQLSLQDNALIREVKFVDEDGKTLVIAK